MIGNACLFFEDGDYELVSCGGSELWNRLPNKDALDRCRILRWLNYHAACTVRK